MKVVFSHGKESGPWGRKIKVLADIALRKGMTIESIDYTGILDPEVRVNMLDDYLTHQQQLCILVGSSMGGYVSTVNALSHNVVGLFLLAPALYMPSYQVQEYPVSCKTEVVHGWGDDVIAPSHSMRFAEHTNATLHLIDSDHGLSSALSPISIWFEQFLETLK